MKNFYACIAVMLLLAGCAGHSTPGGGYVLSPSFRDLSPATMQNLILNPSTAESEPESDLIWYDARYLTIEGKGWEDTQRFYERLPARAENMVPEAVWNLSKHTAGICVRFMTDSKSVGAIWDGGGAMYHMASTANSGLDLYEQKQGKWKFVGVSRPKETRSLSVMRKNGPGEMTHYLLYLPLYNDVTELMIGVDPNASLLPAPERNRGDNLPIVFYGTSITQGGCAARCGMCHAALLGRWLDREVINLGFSGAGKMEPELAELVSELDACVYVFECLPNMTTEMVKERVEPFIKFVRGEHPATPILLVENPINAATNPGNAELRKIYAKLLSEGVAELYYLKGEPQWAAPENETVDGSHPTDLGFYRMASVYLPVMQDILEIEGRRID